MVSNILIFTMGLLSITSVHGLNMRLASQTATATTNRAKKEYQRHACGRAIAAIQNFEIIAANLQRSPGSPTKAISDSVTQIQNALIDNYGIFYKIERSACIDRRTQRPVVTAYRRGPDNRLESPNFSYRFL